MNYRLTLCYDGTRYNGWQKQGNTPNTIQEKLETALEKICGEKVEIHGCGRTDAGVHAQGQVCSFRTVSPKSEAEILSELRRYLPEDIGAISLETADERFHARLSCKEKTYVYRIWNSEAPNVFERKYMYAFPDSLNIPAMRTAAELFIGQHDFAAFSSVKRSKKSTVRTITKIEIQQNAGELSIAVTGNGFLYNMVRILTGTLLEVGTGKRSADSIERAFATGDRAAAGFTTPAKGLTLREIQY